MNAATIIYYIFAGLAILSALAVVIAKNPVRAVLNLILTFILTAVTWVILAAPFLAFTLIIVYVGAVMVLFLFVVMLVDIDLAQLREGFTAYMPLAVIVACAMLGFLIFFIIDVNFDFLHKSVNALPAMNNIKALGTRLFSQYLYPFELAGEILMIAIVGSVALAYGGIKKRKTQDISSQVQVTKAARLKIVEE
jgi:NADH-quinone oxidoreductase subunit J